MRYYENERECIDLFREEYEFLSNFYPALMEFEGIEFYNAEAAYQAQKCRNKEERLHFSRMYADAAKRQGRKAECREDWKEVRIPVMRAVVRAKFDQNPVLARRLLETGEKPLKEGNYWGDLFWGINLHTGEGENHLGKILMELRDTYKKEGLPEKREGAGKKSFAGRRDLEAEFVDITQADCECIVNAANETLLGGGGVDGAIHREAGRELMGECRQLGGCKTGEAKITGGYRLRASYVIHTVGPHYGEKKDRELLASCYRSCMELARENGIRSIAFPAISVGKFSYPKREAARTAVETVRDWKEEHPDYGIRVVFCTVDPGIYEYFCEFIQQYS